LFPQSEEDDDIMVDFVAFQGKSYDEWTLSSKETIKSVDTNLCVECKTGITSRLQSKMKSFNLLAQ
jgi:hypothetical protein